MGAQWKQKGREAAANAKGKVFSKIAKEIYKDANKYMKIFDANKDQLTNPDQIKVGQKLKLPN